MTLLFLFLLYALVLTAALSRAGHRSRMDPSDGEARRQSEGTAPSGGEPRRPPGGTVPSSEETHHLSLRVLIIGATGGTGGQLVTQALARGHTVTALVRDPSKLHADHPQLTVVRGDVLDEGSVDAAMRGQDAVLSALGHKRFFGPTRILSEGTRIILRAMETRGARRLVCVTSLGIGDSAGRMGLYYTFFVIPVILPFYFWDKTRQERLVAGSNVEWVIARPGLLTDGGKRGRLRHGLHTGSFLLTERVSRADVADFMLDQLVSDMYLRTAPGVCG